MNEQQQIIEALAWANSLCSEALKAAKQKNLVPLRTLMKNEALKVYYEGKFTTRTVTDEIFATVRPDASAAIAAVYARYKHKRAGDTLTMAEIREAPKPVSYDAGFSRVKHPGQLQQWLEARSAVDALMQKVGNLESLPDGDLDLLYQELLTQLKKMQVDRVKAASAQLTPAEYEKLVRRIEGERDKRRNAISTQGAPATESAPPSASTKRLAEQMPPKSEYDQFLEAQRQWRRE